MRHWSPEVKSSLTPPPLEVMPLVREWPSWFVCPYLDGVRLVFCDVIGPIEGLLLLI